MLTSLVSFALASPLVPANDPDVSEALAAVLSDSPVPGAVGAILHVGQPPRIGTYGVAKAGEDTPVTPGAVVHLGSETKAMTAVLIARLVDKGTLSWTTTVASGLPGLVDDIHPDYHEATLLDLLRHTARVPANPPNWRLNADRPMHERRLSILRDALASAPKGKKGAYGYSNLGYMMAGAIAEEATGETWEVLITREVFEPLSMSTAGFGVPPTENGGGWGHTVAAGKPTPIRGDNAAALGPAGTVHMAVADWARFLTEFLASGATPGFLSDASRVQLLEVGANNYACGWMVLPRPWAGGNALHHAGSNTTWFAVVWLAPAQDRGFLVVANAAGDGVPGVVDQAVAGLIKADR